MTDEITITLRSMKHAPYGLFAPPASIDEKEKPIFWLTETSPTTIVEREKLSDFQLDTLLQSHRMGIIQVSGLNKEEVAENDEVSLIQQVSEENLIRDESEVERSSRTMPIFNGSDKLLEKTGAEIRTELEDLVKRPDVYSFLIATLEREKTNKNRKTVIAMFMSAIDLVKRSVFLSKSTEELGIQITSGEERVVGVILPRQTRNPR